MKLTIGVLLSVMTALWAGQAQAEQAWKVGDTAVIEFQFSQADVFVLTNESTRSEINNSIAIETAKRIDAANDLDLKIDALQRAAEREGSWNPLLKSRASKAIAKQNFYSALAKDNQRALKTLSEISTFSHKKVRISQEQLRKLASFRFTEEIKLARKSDFLRVSARLNDLADHPVSAEWKPASPLGFWSRTSRYIRTPKGILTLAGGTNLAIWGGYSAYAAYQSRQSDKAENDFHDVLVYDVNLK